MTPREEIREAMKRMPVSWFHEPGQAAKFPIPVDTDTRKDAGPKVLPVVAYTALGVVTGGALQLASQYLDDDDSGDSKCIPYEDLSGIRCHLPYSDIEDRAVQIYEDSLSNKDGGALKAIVDAWTPPAAKCWVNLTPSQLQQRFRDYGAAKPIADTGTPDGKGVPPNPYTEPLAKFIPAVIATVETAEAVGYLAGVAVGAWAAGRGEDSGSDE